MITNVFTGDLTHPICVRCIKSGNGASCTYTDTFQYPEDHRDIHLGSLRDSQVSSALDLPISGSRLSGADVEGRLRAQDERISQLEQKLAMASSAALTYPLKASNSPDANISKVVSHASDSMMFRSKGFKTKFYGAGAPSTLMIHVGRFNN